MSDQKLDNRELLNVRWAFDDPNPKARKEVNTVVRFLLPASPPLPPPHAQKRMSIRVNSEGGQGGGGWWFSITQT